MAESSVASAAAPKYRQWRTPAACYLWIRRVSMAGQPRRAARRGYLAMPGCDYGLHENQAQATDRGLRSDRLQPAYWSEQRRSAAAAT